MKTIVLNQRKASRQLVRSYLDTLFDSIVWKDVAKRHNVRNTTDLWNVQAN